MKRSVTISILSLIAVALLLVVAVPALAAGPFGGHGRGSANTDVAGVHGTTVRGTASGSITITPASPGSAIPLSMPTGNVTAVYSVSGTTNTLEQLMVNMPRQAPGIPGTPPVQKGTTVRGTATGTITITPPSPGSAVTLSMPTGNVTAVYSVSGTTNTLERFMVNVPRPTVPFTGQGRGPANSNFARVQGTLTVNADGSITITPTNGNSAAATLTLGPNTNLTLHGITSLSNANGKAASAIYDSQSKVANQVTVNMPKPNMPKPNMQVSRPFRPGARGSPGHAKTA